MSCATTSIPQADVFHASTELYDLIYSFKDFAAESADVVALLAREAPGARRVLDVACGTGQHARHLRALGDYAVDGIDLHREYDVVLCLFSSIGYVRTLDNVRRTLHCFRRHLAPGGIILVEPWFAPDQWHPGRVSSITAEGEGITVTRMSRAALHGSLSTIEFHYLVGTAAGIEHRTELHELGLFTVTDMTACFRDAGLDVRHDPHGLTGRGLYLARAAVG